MSKPLTSRNWFGKASAGFVMGLAFALGVSGLLFQALDIGESFFSLPGQFTMWIIAPVWCTILSFCFFFRNGLRAWLILGTAAAAIWTALFAMGALS